MIAASLIVIIAGASSPTDPDASTAAPMSVAGEQRSDGEREILFVTGHEVEVTDAPNGQTINHFYRGQRIEVFAEADGWVRINDEGWEPRWVRRAELSPSEPQPLPQPSTVPAADDPRLAAIPLVGQYGHTEADVIVLRRAALELLTTQQCSRIDDANKSVTAPGVYYINCGESSNRFFRVRSGEPEFCGRTASACR